MAVFLNAKKWLVGILLLCVFFVPNVYFFFINSALEKELEYKTQENILYKDKVDAGEKALALFTAREERINTLLIHREKEQEVYREKKKNQLHSLNDLQKEIKTKEWLNAKVPYEVQKLLEK